MHGCTRLEQKFPGYGSYESLLSLSNPGCVAPLVERRLMDPDFEEIWSSLARFCLLAIVPQSAESNNSSMSTIPDENVCFRGARPGGKRYRSN
jgi:hypothetical protein